ncbi:hypothetical protein [Lysobacter firmicutimachus]|uniref:Uncharacterized protein n=1 Tax=Lysobacter firmicutimachus TaxID=1792846 RepID=A0ABU8CYK0_9GAMM
MKLSLKPLGTFVNLLNEGGRAVVSESHFAQVSINGLSFDDATQLLALLSGFGLVANIVDDAEQELDANSLLGGIAPFSVTFAKPEIKGGIGFITTFAFQGWLKNPDISGVTHVAVACATAAFATEAFVVSPWEWSGEFTPKPQRKSPRLVVIMRGSSAVIPVDIRPYLLHGVDDALSDDPVMIAWSDAAADVCVASLASEIEGSNGKLTFTGPPRLEFDAPVNVDSKRLVQSDFSLLQGAVRWVYAVERETDLKHRLFGQEFSRLANKGGNLADEMSRVVASALDGANIAYGFSVQEMSREALKGLADLRKAVADETQKASEAARQLALNAAGAEFYALGLLAARVTSTVDPFIIDCMAALGVFYVIAVLYINWRYLIQQGDQRKVWRAKLYRYLTDDDYTAMVIAPISHSERLLRWMMVVIAILSLVTFAAIWVINHAV